MQKSLPLLLVSLVGFAMGSCKDVRLGTDGVDGGGGSGGSSSGSGGTGAGGATNSAAGTTSTGGATSSTGGTIGTGGATASAGGTTGSGGTTSTGGTTTGGTTTSTGGTTITTLATGLNSPYDLVVDATSVYFINMGTFANSYTDSALMKVPIGGGKTTTIASGPSTPSPFLVAGNNIYGLVFSMINFSPGSGSLVTIPISGGKPATLASGLLDPSYITVDSSNLYWTNSLGGGPIMKMPLAGGTPTTFASISTQYLPSGIAVDATSVYWLNTDSAGDGMPPPYHTTIMKASISGGTPVILASITEPVPGGGGSIAVDATSVYWTNAAYYSNLAAPGGSPAPDGGAATCTGTVMKVAIAGGTPTTLASGDFCPSNGIAVDAAAVYWANDGAQANGYTDGSVMEVPLEGGAPITLAAMQTIESGPAIDATSVYWTTGGTPNAVGAVLKTAKIPFDCNLGVALNAIAALGLTVVGNPQTLNFTLPAVLTTDDEWGLKSPLCQDGGYDITPLAGKSACIVEQATTQRCDGYPATVWVLMSNGAVKCVYKGSGAGNPGVYSAADCAEPTIAAGATVLCGATSCTSATGPCCPAETMMDRVSMCMPDCSPAVTCDGPEDCGTGQVCCSLEWPAADFSGASCVGQFNCIQPSQRVICHQDADCPSPQHCGVPNPMPAYVPASPSSTTTPLYWEVAYRVCAP